MLQRIKPLAERIHARNTETFKRRQKLLTHKRHTLHQRVGLVRTDLKRAVQIVQHFKKRHDHRTSTALNVLLDLLAKSRAGLVELIRCAAVLRDKFMDLPVLVGDSRFEFFDQRRLQSWFFGGRGIALSPRPPAAIGHFHVTHIRLLKPERQLIVRDPNPTATDILAQRGAEVAASVREVADKSAIVLACMPTVAIAQQLVDEAAEGAAIKGFVNLGTTGSKFSQAAAEKLKAQGIAYLDAPISGGPPGAEAATRAGAPGARAPRA